MVGEEFLKVSNLKVKFGQHPILEDLNLVVKRDETLAVVGHNGAGKTVFFKCLLGLIPYEGEINWHKDAKVGYVPQKLSISPDLPLTVMEFLKLKENDSRKINETLAKIGFKAKAEHVHHDIRVLNARLGNLSGGELQRILIAYALLGDPNVLLLDEPTAGVDIKGEKTFYSLFGELKKDNDLTIIFISHDHEIVEKYADETLMLNHEH